MANKDLSDFALAVIVLGLTVTVGSAVLFQYKIGQVTNLPTYVVNNETITPVNAGNETSTIWVKSFDKFTNATSGANIASGNFTTSVDANWGIGKIANASAVWGGQKINATYTVYNTSDPRFDLANDAENGLLEYGNWFKLLVIAGVAGLVLYLVFKTMGKGSTGAASGSY